MLFQVNWILIEELISVRDLLNLWGFVGYYYDLVDFEKFRLSYVDWLLADCNCGEFGVINQSV